MSRGVLRRLLERAALPLALAGLLGLGFYLESLKALRPLARVLQGDYAHRSDFPGNKTVRFLSRLGVLHPVPATSMAPLHRRTLRPRGQAGRDALAYWGVGPGDPARFPSTQELPAEARALRAPVLSVHLAKRDLREVLDQNHPRRGRHRRKK